MFIIPRSVKRKHKENDNSLTPRTKKPHIEQAPPTIETTDAIAENEDEAIKARSADQRPVMPGEDEPECIVCGKYGEYVNDDTENDVCSLECKLFNTDTAGRSRTLTTKLHKAKVVHHNVADNLHAKWTNYQEPDELANMPKWQVDAMLKAHHLKVEGRRVPRPVVSFDQLQGTLGTRLLENLETLNWSMAQGVQRQAVPVGLSGRDMHIIAPPHSGRTAAFLIPVLVHCQSLNAMFAHKRRAGPYALVLAPTRHACEKTERIAKQLARGMRNMRTALLVGGQPLANQLYRLRKGAQIVIGTPSRVLELMVDHPHLLRAWKAPMIILHGADALLAVCFRNQTRQILGKISDVVVQQTILVSSDTRSTQEQLQYLARRLVSPVEIHVVE